MGVTVTGRRRAVFRAGARRDLRDGRVSRVAAAVWGLTNSAAAASWHRGGARVQGQSSRRWAAAGVGVVSATPDC